MNIIEENIKKFNKAKKKLKNQDFTKLTETYEKSILSILNNQKIINNNKTNSSPNLTKEKKLINQKEKKKFLTEKFDEQNTLKNNNQKEISPILKTNKLNPNQKNPIGNKQNSIKQNFTDNNKRKSSTKTYGANINLLNMAQEIQEYFDKERNALEEKQNNLVKNEKNVEFSEESHEPKKKDVNLYELDDFDDSDDEEIEKDKNKNCNKNKNDSFKNLFLYKKESIINLNEKFNIFDETKMMKDNDDNSFDDYIEDMDNNDYLFNKSFEKTKKKNENKSNKIPEKNKNVNDNENNINIINNIYNSPIKEKEKENKNNQNDFMDLSGGSNGNNLKICIPLDKLDLTFSQIKEDKKNIIHKKEIIKKSNKANEKKYLGKKTKKIESPINKKNMPSKSEPNIINIEHKNNLLKYNKKVIMDDEDEEEEQQKLTTEKNILTNSLFKSPITKNGIKDDSLGAFLTNEGTKFTLKLESDTKSKNNKKVSDFNNNFNKNLNLNPPKNISINTDSSNKIKNNNNKINLINKNKNGSQNNSNKDIINNTNYDLICLNNVKKILININEKLLKENIEKISIKKYLENIEDIKKAENDIKRKKQTYIVILKPIYYLFSIFNENKIYKNYINEISQLLENIQKYFKNVKKYHGSINSNQFYYKRKIVFKYIFSKFELKVLDHNSLKGILTKKDNSNNNNNNNEAIINMKKFIKTYKRYTRTSEFLLKEMKDFREKINNSPKTKSSENMKKKFESCPANIQLSPHFMSYIKLFNHCAIILTFYNDYKKFLKELEEKNEISKDKTTTLDKNKGKSVQIKNNINGFNNKPKERDKSVEKHREREKFKEK